MKTFIAAAALFLACGPVQAAFQLDAEGIWHALFGKQDTVQSISYGGVDYISGFYDADCGFDSSILGESIQIGDRELYIADNGSFPMLFECSGSGAFTISGTLYCAQSQLEAARKYYADDANYDYYCQVGAQYTDREPEFVQIPDMEPDQFCRLMEFAVENSYAPSDGKNADLLHLPIPDRDQSPELTFYRVSKDKCLVSYRGYTFHIIDGRLMLLYFYDFGHGEYEEMAAVEVPEEMREYFVNLLKNSGYMLKDMHILT